MLQAAHSQIYEVDLASDVVSDLVLDLCTFSFVTCVSEHCGYRID